MERRTLGQTGPEVGVIVLGTDHLEQSNETLDAVLRAAVEAGSSYVDLLYVEPEYWEACGPVYRTYRDHLVLAARRNPYKTGFGVALPGDWARGTMS